MEKEETITIDEVINYLVPLVKWLDAIIAHSPGPLSDTFWEVVNTVWDKIDKLKITICQEQGLKLEEMRKLNLTSPLGERSLELFQSFRTWVAARDLYPIILKVDSPELFFAPKLV